MNSTNTSTDLTALEHSKAMYLAFENPITKFFKNFLRENALLRKYPSFLLQYKFMAFFHHMLFPFMYIKKGDTCVQVGCAEWMLDFGVSMPLIMSAIVGERGRVIVVEPDQRNIEALRSYMKKNYIHNITIVPKAAWREKTTNQFTFYEDRSSTNIITEVEESVPWKNDPQYQGRKKRIETIEMDTIDNIIQELGITPDFVNLTINSAEFDVIHGMTEVIRKGVIVAWLFGDRPWWREAIDYFRVKNYSIIACDSAYSHRAPTVNGRVRMYSHKEISGLFDIMHAVAMPSVGRVPDHREFPAILYKRKDFDFFVQKIDTF
ncbi:hypothetical protein BK004_01260 [bacterium CG10_46_32]|nr:MAG: hypothetical protein BK004_01260 [bacterium CG10_46_32]PIR56327.1 MAG: hypothetical protein COU73_01275 [Parcubacteria group bacterium CG10_big_fil_rev_8_21_14_0_10_46_32]